MIVDDILSLFLALMSLVVELVLTFCISLLNIAFLLIELAVGLFVSGFSIKRIERTPKSPGSTNAKTTSAAVIAALAITLFIVAGVVFTPKIMNRKVTLVAEDGNGLPFAALTLHAKNGDRSERTDKSGIVLIPR